MQIVVEEMKRVWETKELITTVDMLELGTGSGIFTGTLLKLLSQKDNEIETEKFYFYPKDLSFICTEPANDFLNLFTQKFPRIPLVQCKAESIPFKDSSVGVVAAATSFNWFDTEKALAEIYRILVHRGLLGLF